MVSILGKRFRTLSEISRNTRTWRREVTNLYAQMWKWILFAMNHAFYFKLLQIVAHTQWSSTNNLSSIISSSNKRSKWKHAPVTDITIVWLPSLRVDHSLPYSWKDIRLIWQYWNNWMKERDHEPCLHSSLRSNIEPSKGISPNRILGHGRTRKYIAISISNYLLLNESEIVEYLSPSINNHRDIETYWEGMTRKGKNELTK